MNKKLKLLQKPTVLETLEVEQVKHELSQVSDSTIVMVAYDDSTGKFLIGDESGDLYVASLETLSSLDISADSDISTILSKLTKSSIAEHFSKLTVQEATEMFGDKYVYYWSANGKLYGVNKGIIERLDNGPDAASKVELWDRSENVLSNDRGVNELTEIKFSADLRPAFLTFSAEALPTFTRDEKLTIRDPVDIADIMNKDLQVQTYVPSGSHYGYDMKDSNAVMKAYLGTDDLVIINNNDRRNVEDIDPPTTDPDNADVTYSNNTPFNHNYSMLWSQVGSGRLFEEFNDEAEDSNSSFTGMTRHEQLEVTTTSEAAAVALSDDDEDTTTTAVSSFVSTSGAYANVPNLGDTYTTYVQSDSSGDKQLYDSGKVANSIRNDTKWSLDTINGSQATVTRRVYNTITGEVTNAERHYDAVIDFEITNIKDSAATIKRTIRVPILNNTICTFDKFEYKHDSSGNAISLDIPKEYVSGIVEYSLDTDTYKQGTNGVNAYGRRKIFVQSGATKQLLESVSITGTAAFSVYNLVSNATTADIKRTTSINFTNTDNSTYNYATTTNIIGTGTVTHAVASAVTSVSGANHLSRHTRSVVYTSGATNVTVRTDVCDPVVNYEIFTLAAGATTATLKGSSTGTYYTWSNGAQTSTKYNDAKSRHITVASAAVRYTRNTETYSSSGNTCSQTLYLDYTYSGVKITKSITASAAIVHSVWNIAANATTGTIKRVFTPVFYTWSNGAQTSTIFKNSVVEIDSNKTGAITYSVGSDVQSASNGVHYARHTRTLKYTQNNITLTIYSDTSDVPITYRIYTLTAGKSTATFKGSSTGVFKIITSGSAQNTTYNQVQNNHITVESAAGTWSNSAVTYTSATNVTCTRTLTFGYTYGGVTKSLSISKTAAVSHSLCNATSSGATIYRKFTPSFKTITNGAETATVYNASTVTIDSNQAGTVAYTVTSAPTSAASGNHYATHTRTITYKNGNFTFVMLRDTCTNAAVSYAWYTLSTSGGTFKGSSTGTFYNYTNGAKQTTTFTKTQSNHITATASLAVTDNAASYSNGAGYCSATVTGSYAYGGVTKTLTKTSATGTITHWAKTIAANATTATIGRKYNAVIKAITNGSEVSGYYYNNTRVISDVTSNTIAYGTLTAVATGVGSAVNRTVSYTNNGVTITLLTDASSNYNTYTVASHSNTTGTYTNTIYGRWYTYENGAKTSTIAVTKSVTSAAISATVTHDSFVYTGDSGTKTARILMKNGSTVITTKSLTPTASYGWNAPDYNNKTITVYRTVKFSGTFISGGTPYTYSQTTNSSNSAIVTHLLKNGDMASTGYVNVTPVMSAAANFKFAYIGASGSYNNSYRSYSGNAPKFSVKPWFIGVYNTSVSCTCNATGFMYGSLYIRTSDDASSAYAWAGTALSGTCSSVKFNNTLVAPSCGTHKGGIFNAQNIHHCYSRAYYTVSFSGSWNSIGWATSAQALYTSSSYDNGKISVSGSNYNWKYHYYTPTHSVTVGSHTATYQYISSTRSSNLSASPSGTTLDSWYNASGTYISTSSS